MKRILCASIACWFLTGCSGERSDGGEALGVAGQGLNGALSPNGFLTRVPFNQPDETLRQAATRSAYETTGVAPNGSTSGGTIASRLGTLSDFQAFYGVNAGDPIAFYYNRGDLGIGREMRCADRMSDTSNEQIACFVKNYSAGDDASPVGGDASEFIFGMNSSVAFANMAAFRQFATVAMVFRNKAPVGRKVIFMVYDAAGNLANSAALDRHGLNFANEFKHNPFPDPATFGTPGVNFNNHIPTNCMSCHGTHSSVFLPFDLDQFEYENAPGRTRADQLGQFKRLNEAVRKVAAFSNNTSIRDQLDGWYNNTRKTNDRTEVFENAYDSNFVPAGWNGSQAARNVYRAVIRGNCRSCHVASILPFDTEDFFQRFNTSAADDLCNYKMPHALQSLREFWQSSAPTELENYLRGSGFPFTTEAANMLRGCGPGNIATLDPHLIEASLASL